MWRSSFSCAALKPDTVQPRSADAKRSLTTVMVHRTTAITTTSLSTTSTGIGRTPPVRLFTDCLPLTFHWPFTAFSLPVLDLSPSFQNLTTAIHGRPGATPGSKARRSGRRSPPTSSTRTTSTSTCTACQSRSCSRSLAARRSRGVERGKRLDGDRVVVTDHVELAPSCVFFMHTPTLNAITPKSYALHAHTNNAITSMLSVHTPTMRSLPCPLHPHICAAPAVSSGAGRLSS